MIQAERQWEIFANQKRYYLDFAIFCANAPIAVETDGDTWHTIPEQANQDYIRQNALESRGWHVLRFNSKEISDAMETYCIPEILNTINSQGGLSDDGLVPRIFYSEAGSTQLSMFEQTASYHINICADENLEY